jgi:hypothetical protein
MNYFKLLYGLDISGKSCNYKNFKMAVIHNISFYLVHHILSPEHTLSVFEGVCRRLTVTEWTCRVFIRPIAPQFSRTHAR